MSGTKVVKNALWNVINGMSGALVAVIVPPFLTNFMPPEAYGSWALALQIGTYMSLFGFGVQIAVGRFVAHCEARNDYVQRDGIVATSFWVLTASATVGFAAICWISANINKIIPDISPSLLDQTRISIVLVALALSANLPASVFAAVFIGRQESRTAATIQGVGRLSLRWA